MPEPFQLSVAEAAGEIRQGNLSPVELAQSLLARIDALDPSLNAWVTIDREEVLSEAKSREDELGQGGPKGPIHGVPVGLKDIYYTAGMLTACGSRINADFMPSRPVSEAVLKELSGRDWQGISVLLPSADIGRDELEKGLTEMGAKVNRLAAYRNVPVEGVSGLAKKAFLDGVDIVTFTSSSTVRNLVEMLDGDRTALESSFIACIGPVTSATARELGLRVDLEATEHTVEGLVDALISHFASRELSRK